MERISSKGTFFFKRVFPLLWFGFLVGFECLFLFSSAPKSGATLIFIIFPFFLAIMGYQIMKKMVWELADEVYDEGDSLIVKKGNVKETILLSEIKNISYLEMANPPRVTINIRRETSLGKEISFSAVREGLGFRKNPLILDLIDRIDALR